MKHRSTRVFPPAHVGAVIMAALLAQGACASSTAGPTPQEPTSSSPAAAPAKSGVRSQTTADAPNRVPAGKPAEKPLPGAAPSQPFHQLVHSLSEKGEGFVSDNLISNEESYLHVAEQMTEMIPKGRGYIGVGPDQNFSYIALLRPAVAFIVDIRRENMLQHLLYKAMFAEAQSRSHFLTMLLGRPYDKATDPGPKADIHGVLAHATSQPASRETCSEIHIRLMKRVDTYHVELSQKDRKWLAKAHQTFRKEQLDMAYQLHVKTRPRFPTFRKLLTATTLDGKAINFLGSEEAFRFVQRMEAEHRIIPVVGDVAGKQAMPGVAAYLEDNELPLGAIYTSNVEEYLLFDKSGRKWKQWIKNVDALPTDEKSLLVRSYMSGSQRHPRHVKGFLSVHLLQNIDIYLTREKKRHSRYWWKVSTRDLVPSK